MFERGFKAWCERYASEKREELGLKPSDPLDSFKLAANLGIRVWTPHDVPGLDETHIATLLRNDGKTPSCWSAVTLVVGSRVVVILNSSHSTGRQASDLTHELAHRIRGHKAHDVEVSAEGLMLLKSYDKQQEEEADWLSGCLLLPREALIAIKKRRLALPDAAAEFGVSQRMLNYRLAMTGVNRQFA
ncbi:ImmA/IrrE family metallo-endopeptidase [Ralstonia pseudosolanacearum]